MKNSSFFRVLASLHVLVFFCQPLALNAFFDNKMVAKQCLGLGAAVGTASCLKVVSTGDECLIERFGKYHRSLGPGIHVIFRPFESISFQDTLREQVLDVPPQECFTADNAPLSADAIVYLRIFNMKDACYEVFNVKNAVLNLCLTHVREEIGRLTLEESFSSREELNKALLESLNGVCRNWGIEITRVKIQQLEPSNEIKRSMESQTSADRKQRATILQSEGERTKLVNEAEGRAQAMVADAEAKKKSIILASQAEAERQRLEAEGIRMAIKTVADAMNIDGKSNNKAMQDSLQFLGVVRYLETQGKFASSDGTKVLMFPSMDKLPVNIHSLIQQ